MAILGQTEDTFNDPVAPIREGLDGLETLMGDLKEDMSSADWDKFAQDAKGIIDWDEEDTSYSDFRDMDSDE